MAKQQATPVKDVERPEKTDDVPKPDQAVSNTDAAGALPPTPPLLPSLLTDAAVKMPALGDTSWAGLLPTTIGGPDAAWKPWAGSVFGDPTKLPKMPEVYTEPKEPTTRPKFIGDFKEYLGVRAMEIQALPPEEQAKRIESLLRQVGDVSSRLNNGKFTDLWAMGTGPDKDAPTGAPKDGYVPPELISAIRPLIKQLEVPQAIPRRQLGETDPNAKVEGSLYSNVDWNSRLGVPQYRTQSDNLASPEATCNVTAFSMALERLGYGRESVTSAIERDLKAKYVKENKIDVEAAGGMDKIELPKEYYESAVATYLKANTKGKAYQQLRGGNTSAKEREAIAKDFSDNAQMEDQLAFLLHLNKIPNTEVAGRANDILAKIEPDADKRPTAERTFISNTNYADVKTDMNDALTEGGAVMMSLRHKGTRSNATHIVSVQDASRKDGLTIDDPYGWINPNYRKNKGGDAFATKGTTRDLKNQANLKDKEDWKVARAQNPDANERKGESYNMSDDQAGSKNFGNYALIFRRAAPKVPEEAAP
ncbi:MAG: hypothetical protein H6735_00575 [Alphaproteobacteria bacterium]|nr:hypothetical protein [Alphaproteobacteria bacterium]